MYHRVAQVARKVEVLHFCSPQPIMFATCSFVSVAATLASSTSCTFFLQVLFISFSILNHAFWNNLFLRAYSHCQRHPSFCLFPLFLFYVATIFLSPTTVTVGFHGLFLEQTTLSILAFHKLFDFSPVSYIFQIVPPVFYPVPRKRCLCLWNKSFQHPITNRFSTITHHALQGIVFFYYQCCLCPLTNLFKTSAQLKTKLYTLVVWIIF